VVQGRETWKRRETVLADEVAALAALYGAIGRRSNSLVSPGYAAALTMRAVLDVMHDDRLALPFDHNVHASQEIEWYATLEVGTDVTTRASVGDVWERARVVFFDVLTETWCGDQLCLSGTSTQALRHD
jgi:hypothetical protein